MNWIAVIVLLAVFLLVLWLTSLIARVAGAGRSGIGWVFLAVVVSGLASGVIVLFLPDFSGLLWFGWILFLIVSVLVFALVTDAGLLGGMVVGLSYTLLIGVVFIVANLLEIRSVGDLTRTIESDTPVAGQSREIASETEPVEPIAPEATVDQTAAVAEPEAEEMPAEIIRNRVEEPAREDASEEEQKDAPPAKPDADFRVAAPEKAEEYIGYRVRISRHDGVVLEGVLTGADQEKLDIRIRESGGYAILHEKMAGIRLLEVWR